MPGLPDGLDDEALAPPAPGGVLREVLALRELARLAARAPWLATAPRGRGQPVVALPGHSSSDLATAPLRGYLSRLGYDARGWGLGTNHGNVGALLPAVTDAVRRHHHETGQPVHLIGWSLGGVIAREVSRDAPGVVAQVITYGTPVVGGPLYTLAAGSYSAQQLESIAVQVEQRDRVPVSVPLTAFFSRRDRVVSWRACIDRHNDHVEHIEVRSTHVGMGIDPDVWLRIAQRLAHPPAHPGSIVS